MSACMNCGTEIEGVRFCATCGAKNPDFNELHIQKPDTTSKKVCPTCGGELHRSINDASIFSCKICGQKFRINVAPSFYNGPSQGNSFPPYINGMPTKSKNKKTIGIIAGVAILFLFLLIFLNTDARKIEGTWKNMYGDVAFTFNNGVLYEDYDYEVVGKYILKDGWIFVEGEDPVKYDLQGDILMLHNEYSNYNEWETFYRVR